MFMEDYYKIYIIKENSHFNLKKLKLYSSFWPVRELSKHNIIFVKTKKMKTEETDSILKSLKSFRKCTFFL